MPLVAATLFRKWHPSFVFLPEDSVSGVFTAFPSVQPIASTKKQLLHFVKREGVKKV